MKLWVCGRTTASTDQGEVWEMQGVFDDRAKAVAACKSARDFIAPITLNEVQPEETTEWPGAEFPLYESVLPEPEE